MKLFEGTEGTAALTENMRLLDTMAEKMGNGLVEAPSPEPHAPLDEAKQQKVNMMVREVGAFSDKVWPALEHFIDDHVAPLQQHKPVLQNMLQTTPITDVARVSATMAMSFLQDPKVMTSLTQAGEETKHACNGLEEHCVQTELVKRSSLIATQIHSTVRSHLGNTSIQSGLESAGKSLCNFLSIFKEPVSFKSKANPKVALELGGMIAYIPTFSWNMNGSIAEIGIIAPLFRLGTRDVMAGWDLWLPIGSTMRLRFRLRLVLFDLDHICSGQQSSEKIFFPKYQVALGLYAPKGMPDPLVATKHMLWVWVPKLIPYSLEREGGLFQVTSFPLVFTLKISPPPFSFEVGNVILVQRIDKSAKARWQSPHHFIGTGNKWYPIGAPTGAFIGYWMNLIDAKQLSLTDKEEAITEPSDSPNQ